MLKNKKIMALVLAIGLMQGTAALAETHTTSPTHDGTTVNCKLVGNFSLTGNDEGKAYTSWAGRTDHQIGVVLYQCQNAASNYYKLDGDSDPKSVAVTGYKSGVWKFKSVHQVFHMSNGSIASQDSLATLTDW